MHHGWQGNGYGYAWDVVIYNTVLGDKGARGVFADNQFPKMSEAKEWGMRWVSDPKGCQAEVDEFWAKKMAERNAREAAEAAS